MKKLIAVLGLVATAFSFSASADTWIAETLDSTGSQISTQGDLVYAYCQCYNKNYQTNEVNGVKFVEFSDNGDFSSKQSNVSVSPSFTSWSNGYGNEGVSGNYATILMGGWNRSSGFESTTYTLKNLESGKQYLVQIFLHNNYLGASCSATIDGKTIYGGGTGWTYGGTLTGTFTASSAEHAFTVTYAGLGLLNAIQVRNLSNLATPPSIEAVTVTPNFSTATVDVTGVVMGTDDSGDAATKYTLDWTLTGPTSKNGSLENLTASSFSTNFTSLADGSYSFAATITTDKGKTATKSADFTVSTTPSIGSVVPSVDRATATINLFGVSKGSNASGTASAGSYDVYYSLDGGSDTKALSGQTGASPSFVLAGQSNGNHSLKVWIVTDAEKTSAKKDANFTIDLSPVAPSIGSVTPSVSGTTATLTASGIEKGTNSDGSESATKYTLYYSLTNSPAVSAGVGATAIALNDLADGDYSCNVWIVNDFNVSSSTTKVDFSVNNSVTDFAALKAALEAGDASGKTITIGAMTYTATSSINITAANVTLKSSGGAVIDGTGSYQILNVSGVGFKVEGVTFKNGAGARGGAIGFSSVSVSQLAEIINCKFIDCSATFGGGGVYACNNDTTTVYENLSSSCLVKGCTFTNCGIASSGDSWASGGALHGIFRVEDSTFDGCYANAGIHRICAIAAANAMVISNCVFKNMSPKANGLLGPAYLATSSEITSGAGHFINCTFANIAINQTDGALFYKRAILEGCVVSNTTSTATANGLIPLANDMDSSYCRITSTLFIDNQCPFKLNGKGMPALVNCTFVNNVGGLAFDNDSSYKPAITNCVFWGNQAYSSWPFGTTYKGLPGLYYHPYSSFADLVQIANTVIEGGSSSSDMAGVLAADPSGESTKLTGIVDAAGNPLDANYAVREGTALCGTGAYAEWMKTAVDAAGRNRLNGFEVDIGCYQKGFEAYLDPSTSTAEEVATAVRFSSFCGVPQDDPSGDVGEWIVLTNITDKAIDLQGVKVVFQKLSGGLPSGDPTCSFRIKHRTLPAGGTIRLNQADFSANGWEKITNGDLSLAIYGFTNDVVETSQVSGTKNDKGNLCVAKKFGSVVAKGDWKAVSVTQDEDPELYAIAVTPITNSVDTTLIESLKLDLAEVGAGKVVMVWGGMNRGDEFSNWLYSQDLGSVAAGDVELLVKAPAGYDMNDRKYRYVKFFFTADDGDTYTAISPVANLKNVDWLTAGGVRQCGAVVINEFMAKNSTVYTNAEGRIADWIEIKNVSGYTINLSGWGVSDNSNKLYKATIPAGATLANGAYLVLTCDGETGICSAGEVHLDLSLSTDADECIVFTDPLGTVRSSLVYPQQLKDFSYGRNSADTGYAYYKIPTPGKVNTTTEWGDITPKVEFSEPHGYKTAEFNLTLTCPGDAAADIYYTTDGSSPTTSSTKYTGPIAISKTTCIRAAVPDANSVLQQDNSATYLYVEDILNIGDTSTPAGFPANESVVGNHNQDTRAQNFVYGFATMADSDARERMARGLTNSIRTVSIVIDPDLMFGADNGIYVNAKPKGDWEAESMTMMEQINPVDGSVDEFTVPAGIKIRGANSRMSVYPKHSFHVVFRSKYGMGSLDHPLFGDEGADSFARIDFRSSQNYSFAGQYGMGGGEYDTLIHEVFQRDSQGALGEPYTKSRYYNLFINGVYWGVYQTEERISQEFGETYNGADAADYDVMRTDGIGYANLVVEGDMEQGTNSWHKMWDISENEGFATGTAGEQNYWRAQGLNPDGSRNPDYPVYVNVTNVIRGILVPHFAGDTDSPAGSGQGMLIANNNAAMKCRIDGKGERDGYFFLRHDCEHGLGLSNAKMFKSANCIQEGYDGVFTNGYAYVNTLLCGTTYLTEMMTLYPDRYKDDYGTDPSQYKSFAGASNFGLAELHSQLMKNAEYRLVAADIVYKEVLKLGGALTPPVATARYMKRKAEIEDAVELEISRWRRPLESGKPNSHGLWDFSTSINLEFLQKRQPYYIAQLREIGWYPSIDAPTSTVATVAVPSVKIGTTLSYVSAGADAIYLTTDGSDPRYCKTPATDGKIVLTRNCTIKARAKKGTEWSAMDVTSYVVTGEEGDGYTFTFAGDYTGLQTVNPTGTECRVIFDNASLPGGFYIPDGVEAIFVPNGTVVNTIGFISGGENSKLKLDGTGTIGLTGKDTLVSVSNLVVKSGTFKVTSTGVTATKTPVVKVFGHVKQSGGTIDLDLSAVASDMQAYGIFLASKDSGGNGEIYAEFNDGIFNAKVGGAKSSAVYVDKGSVVATFKDDIAVNAELTGTEPRFVSAAGVLKFNGGDYAVTGTVSATLARAFKTDKQIEVNDGRFAVYLPGDGSEVFSASYNGKDDESAITIDDGKFELTSDDDCFSADHHLRVNGGRFYCVSVNGDIFDSNGDMRIDGGTVLAYASADGHKAFDVNPDDAEDLGIDHVLYVNGGTIFATGGKDAKWPANIAGAVENVYTATGLTASQYSQRYFSITDIGESIYTVKLPVISGECAILASCEDRKSSAPEVSDVLPEDSVDQNFHDYYIKKCVYFYSGDYNEKQTLAPEVGDCKVVLSNANFKAGFEIADGVTARINAASNTVNTISGLMAPNSEVRFTGEGTVKFEGEETLAEVSNLVVKAGTLSVKCIGVKGDNAKVIKVNGFVEQTGGTMDIDLAAISDGQAYGIYLANADILSKKGNYKGVIYAKFDGGVFKAKVNGETSAALYVDKDAETSFSGGEVVSAMLEGVEPRLVNVAGELNFANCQATNVISSGSDARVFKTDKSIEFSSDKAYFKITASGSESEIFSAGDSISVDGGTFELNASDDCLSAFNNITVNGGKIYAVSSDGDVFDSNGDMDINGGTILAYTSAAGHEAFDVEPNKTEEGKTPHQLRIEGGTIFATGGAGSAWPTDMVATNQSVYSAANLTASTYSEQYLSVETTAGIVYAAKLPSFTGVNCSILVTCPNRTADEPTTSSTKPTEGDQDFHEFYIYEKAATNQDQLRIFEVYGSTKTNDVETSGNVGEYIVLTNISDKVVKLEGFVVTSAKYDTDKKKIKDPSLTITLTATNVPAHGSVKLEQNTYTNAGWGKITNGAIYMTLTDSAGNPVQTAYASFDNAKYPKTDMLGASLVAIQFVPAMQDTTEYWKSSADEPEPSDPFPEPMADTPAAVKAAIDAGGFTGSITNITTQAVYDDFKAYCKSTLAITDPAKTTGNIKDNAYLAYVLDAGHIDKALTASDYQVKTFAVTTGGYTVKVEISGVTIGASCKADLLSTVIGAVGSNAVKGEYLPSNVTTTGHAKSDNQIEMKVSPKSASTQFFFKANLLP